MKKIFTKFELELEYPLIPIVNMVIKQFNAFKVSVKYDAKIILQVELKLRDAQVFMRTMINKSSAKELITSIDEKLN